MAHDEGSEASCPVNSMRAAKFAKQGWVIEVILTSKSYNEIVLFAVDEEAAADAEIAVLRYPGIQVADSRIAKRKLTCNEIEYLKLGRGGTRPFDRAVCEFPSENQT